MSLKIPMTIEDKVGDEVKNFLNQGDNYRAINTLLPLATEGHSRACLALGYIYESIGSRERSEYVTAFHWYSRALELEHLPETHHALGRCYFFGLGVQENSLFALRHLEQAKPLESPDAAVMLANIHQLGKNVPKNLSEAKKYYVVGAESGYPFAMIQLANIFQNEGKIFSSLQLRFRAVVQITRLRIANKKDPKLIGLIK